MRKDDEAKAKDVLERVTGAVKALCVGRGDVRSRLMPAIYELVPLRDQDFPTELQDQFRKVMEAATKYDVSDLDRSLPLYLDTRPATKKGYDRCLNWIEAWCGDVPVTSLTVRAIENWYVSHYKVTPSKANHMMTMMRILLNFGVSPLGWIDKNPAEKPRMKGTGKHGKLWSPAAVEACVAMADAMNRHSMGTAVLLNIWIGQRPTDIPRLARENIAGGQLRFTQSKTGAEISLDVNLVPHLVKRLAEERSRQISRGQLATTLLISEATGKPYNDDHFGRVFAQVGEAVERVSERLQEDGEGKPLVFRDSMIENIRGLVDVVPRLNIFGDDRLARLCEQVKEKIASVEPDSFRPSRAFDPAARARVKRDADALMEQFAGYFGSPAEPERKAA